MEIGKYILQKAQSAGICSEWAGLIAGTNSVDELLKMYVKGIDFCLKNNFPSKEDMLRLGGAKLADHGIYINTAVENVSNDFIVLLGNSNAKIKVTGYSVSQLFVKDTSVSEIEISDNAFVMIDCFDNAVLDLVSTGHSKVIINIYGNASVTHRSEDDSVVKIINKNKVTY